MRSLLLLLLFYISSITSFEDFETVPDCDNDFSIHALALIQANMGDIPRLQQVEAILSSCNKGIVQKLTEASVHLLHKGVLPTQLTEQLQQLAASQKKAKMEKFRRMEEGLDDEMKRVVKEISSISTNDSLSGNEKLLAISGNLMRLKKDERERLHHVMHRDSLSTESKKMIAPVQVIQQSRVSPEVKHAPVPPPPTPIGPRSQEIPSISKLEQKNLLPSVIPSAPQILKEKDSLPASFPISPSEQDNLLFSNKRNILKPTGDSEALSAHLKEPSVFLKTNPDSSRTFDIGRSIFHKEPSAPPLGPPISALILNNGRPISVGETKEQERKNVDDQDLLKTRNNIWAEAAKFFDQTTNIPEQLRKLIEQSTQRNGVLKGNPQISAGLNIPANTFPLPAAAYEQLSKALTGNAQQVSETRRYLPNRQRDAIVPEIRYRGLDRFDSHVGRFDKGSGKEQKVLLPSLPYEAAKPVAFEAVKPTERKESPKESGGGTRFFGSENTAIANGIKTMEQEMERKEAFGALPSFNRGVQEFPTYPPPPPVPVTTIATTILGDVHGQRTSSQDRFPNFPSIDNQNGQVTDDSRQAFVPYQGPEEITGSRLYPQEPYNVATGGRRRFVKIDLLNEH